MVYADGIRRGNYVNTIRLDTEYGYPQYRATSSTPRVRVLKLATNGAAEPDLDPIYGYYGTTTYGARGVFIDVPIDPAWTSAAGTDGSMCIWSPEEDALLYEIWQGRWQKGAWVPGVPNGLTYDPNAAGQIFTGKAGGRYDGVSKTVQGVYPKQNNQWVQGLSASRQMGLPYAITAKEILNSINPDGIICNIDSIQHTLAGSTYGMHTLSHHIPPTLRPHGPQNTPTTGPPTIPISHRTIRPKNLPNRPIHRLSPYLLVN